MSIDYETLLDRAFEALVEHFEEPITAADADEYLCSLGLRDQDTGLCTLSDEDLRYLAAEASRAIREAA